jgi:hypothetical protein
MASTKGLDFGPPQEVYATHHDADAAKAYGHHKERSADAPVRRAGAAGGLSPKSPALVAEGDFLKT